MVKPTKKSQVEKKWHLIDAKGQILGRLASKIAPLLIGKNKSYYVRNLDCGDYVVIINAADIKITGKKEVDKKYTSYSGYPGGLHVKTYAQLQEKSPEKIVLHAVTGMLPDNKLKSLYLNKLHIFAGAEHTFTDKFQIKNTQKETKESK